MTAAVQALYARRRWLWAVFAVPAGVLAALIMVVLPPDRTLDNVAEFAFRLSPFALAVLAVALFPLVRHGGVLVVLAVVVFMGFVDTEMVLRILAYGDAPDDQQTEAFQTIYQFELFTATYVVLFGLLAYRLGGARTATVLKVGTAAVLVVISGLNDLTFWAVYSWPDGRPRSLTWASHMTVFLGGPASIPVAFTFLAVHLALAAAVLALPLPRWIDQAVAAPAMPTPAPR